MKKSTPRAPTSNALSVSTWVSTWVSTCGQDRWLLTPSVSDSQRDRHPGPRQLETARGVPNCGSSHLGQRPAPATDTLPGKTRDGASLPRVRALTTRPATSWGRPFLLHRGPAWQPLNLTQPAPSECPSRSWGPGRTRSSQLPRQQTEAPPQGLGHPAPASRRVLLLLPGLKGTPRRFDREL